jgi:hypothetical protein
MESYWDFICEDKSTQSHQMAFLVKSSFYINIVKNTTKYIISFGIERYKYKKDGEHHILYMDSMHYLTITTRE